MGELHLRGDETEECYKHRGGEKSCPRQKDEEGQQEERTQEGSERGQRGFKVL